MASDEISSPDLPDKRRNKLGYHRTSVACGHCRRRKIRCLLAPDDHQGRCSNCIRLKKECNFYPVDQQPPLDGSFRNGSGAESSSNEATISTASSPTYRTGHQSTDQVNGGHYFHPHRLQTNHDDENFYPSSASTMSSAGRTPLSGGGYQMPPNLVASPSWDQSPYAGHSAQSFPIAEESTTPAMWGSNSFPLTMSSPHSHYPINAQPIPISASSPGHQAVFAAHGVSGDMNWSHGHGSLPMRSMPVATGDAMSPQHQDRGFPSGPAAAGQIGSIARGDISHPAHLQDGSQSTIAGAPPDMSMASYGSFEQTGSSAELFESQYAMTQQRTPSSGQRAGGSGRQWSNHPGMGMRAPPAADRPHDRRPHYSQSSHRSHMR